MRNPTQSISLGRLHDLEPLQNKALLIGTYVAGEKTACEDHLKELASLCDTYGLVVIDSMNCPLREIDAGTFLGSGKIEEIRQKALEINADVIIFDDEISPQQQRNIEKLVERLVIDRTELILAVFAQRAHTKEAKLQIELASCKYQMPRLRKLWTHLGRQRSGGASGGFVKGEGEKQIEIDRRILKDKVDKLLTALEEVKKHRLTQRRARQRAEIPSFAIVGYTNAGKSTLLKALTDADVLIEDKLFATLDTTTRKFVLPNHQDVLLIDTVGFIRKLPHLLVAAFRSTLEEALEADILIHMIDVSNPKAPEQAEATYEVLKQLDALNRPIITVLNKVDLCSDRLMIDRLRFKYPKIVEISAQEKRGFDHLMDAMIEKISQLRSVVKLRVPQNQYNLLAEVIGKSRVITIDYEDNDILIEMEIPKAFERKLKNFMIGEPSSDQE